MLKLLNVPESAGAALRCLASCPKVERIILFGSRAVGDHDLRSDIDLAIAAPELTKREMTFLRDKILKSRTLFKIAVTQLEGMPTSLQNSVLKQGVVIYERKKAV